MTTNQPPPPLWTAADLAARWSCSEATVMARVRDRGLPFLSIGVRVAADATGKRGRASLRFKPADVERWEDEQVGRCEAPAGEGTTPPARVRSKGLARGQRAK